MSNSGSAPPPMFTGRKRAVTFSIGDDVDEALRALYPAQLAAAAAAAADAADADGSKTWVEARRVMCDRLSAWMEQHIVTDCQPYQPVAVGATETESE